jgi:hypothetical protein
MWKKEDFFFWSSFYLTRHLALTASRVFKASSASYYVSTREREREKKKKGKVIKMVFLLL